MPTICKKCRGLLIGELALDYYQGRHWRCVNCGWYREELLVRPGRTLGLVKHGVYR